MGEFGGDKDSNHASIADWVGLLNNEAPCQRSTTARPEVGFDFEPSEVQEPFKLPPVIDVSLLDPLNNAFINEHSMVEPHFGSMGTNTRDKVVSDVKARLDDLQVHSFSITEALNKQSQSLQGRRTEQVEKTYFTLPETKHNAEESKDQMQ